ncbi:MAG: hybrid sensor histidine kinase/response regulator [Methanomassiliicoccus sp.]|nr:hybrid sensor histidine kinase/response regulator [Methanomassiliicoccus sp.]
MIRVLFVDDDPVGLETCADLLSAEGDFTVDTAPSGTAALDKITTGNYDAVVSDYMDDPSMNGIDLLRNARAMGYLNTFLLFSEKVDEDVALDAILNGADHYLTKTGKAIQDVSMVSSILQKRQKRINEERERRDEAAYHSLLMRMHEGFAYHRIIYDDDDRPVSSMIIDVNDAFEQLFSKPGESVLGRDVRQLITDIEGFEHEMLKAFNDIIINGKEVRFTERSRVLDRWFSVAIYAPEPGHFVTILSDLTAQKKLEEELELSRKKLYLLGSITRHDLLNQLTALNGYLGLAQLKKDEDLVYDYIAKAVQSGDKMCKILEFSRDYESMGEQRPEWSSAQVVAEIGIGEAQMGDANVIIELEGLEIFTDRMIQKAFHNLGDNAVRHGQAENVRFFYERCGEDLKIICQDDGCGVAPIKRRDMFDDRFGHGLYLVKEVLKMTGMTIRETNPRSGARFEILVPKGGFRFK